MPMIDVYATEGTFSDRKTLARNLASAVMRWEAVPPISLFSKNTAAFIHDLPSDAISNVDGDSDRVRVTVLTTPAALDRAQQLGVIRVLPHRVAEADVDTTLLDRTWWPSRSAPASSRLHN